MTKLTVYLPNKIFSSNGSHTCNVSCSTVDITIYNMAFKGRLNIYKYHKLANDQKGRVRNEYGYGYCSYYCCLILLWFVTELARCLHWNWHFYLPILTKDLVCTDFA